MISIILPVYNEEKNVRKTIDNICDFFNKKQQDYEIIAVNDGSKDKTKEILNHYKENKEIIVVSHDKNIGYGAALRSGFKVAKGDLIFFTDSDGQFDIRDIDKFLREIERNDFVVGYRKERKDPWYRIFYANVFRLIAWVLFGLRTKDIDCAFKLFNKRVLSEIELKSNGALINLEIFVLAKQKGFKFLELPVSHFERTEGIQTGGNFFVIFKALINLLRFWASNVKKSATHKWPIFLLFLIWGTYFISLWPRILLMKTDGLYVGHMNVWGDWGLHIGIASIFAYKSPAYWFAYHPMYAGGKFTYGFLADFISGIFMRFGFSVPFSFVFPSIILSLISLLGMYFLFNIILKSGWKSLLAISFFFLSSGLGFVNFIKDFMHNPNISLLLYPASEYSRINDIQWYTGNTVVGMLVPQRGFLLGMTLSVWVIFFLIRELSKKDAEISKTVLVISGITAGILPITHMHSFITVFIVTGLICFSSIKKWRLWLYYVIPAGIISTILYLIFIYGGIENHEGFFQWMPGWTIKGGFWVWLKTWLYLWGIMLPLAAFGWLVSRKRLSLHLNAFFLGFWLVFILGNLILIQPAFWDNSKLFLYAYFAFSALAVMALSWVWNKKVIGKMFAIILVAILVSTGALELIRLQRTDKNTYLETSIEDIKLGEEIRKETDPLAIFLTSADPNNFIMVWAARPILMGYWAWVENYGFNYKQRLSDLYLMFQGGLNEESLLKKYNVSYVVIGRGAIEDYGANESYFYKNFELAFYNKNYHIYDVRKPITASFINQKTR